MQGAAKKAVTSSEHSVIVAIPSTALSQQLVLEFEGLVGKGSVSFAPTLSRLREAVHRSRPRTILLDDRILDAHSLADCVAEFSTNIATILVAPYERQSEVARLVAGGQVDFVPRSGEWAQLAASLIERRFRWAQACHGLTGTVNGRNIGEVFRHEINNPLTGILGNAELILAHSDRLPAIDTQRIRTVVELAVRLRETVRRVSNAWESEPDSAKSA
jgi:signal transduction histidine kinase